MKRMFLAVALLLAFCAAAEAKSRSFGYCEDGNQSITISGLTATSKMQRSYPSCTITVYLNSDHVTLATLFSDNSGTPLANPFTATSTGYWDFYAANGRYDVKFSGGGITTPFTHFDYPVFDVADYTPASTGTVNSGTGIAYYPAAGTTVSGTGADLGYNSGTHALTGGALLFLNLTASALNPPASAGFTASTNARFAIDTTTGKPHLYDPLLAADETLLRVIDIPVVTSPTDYGVAYWRNSSPPTMLTTTAGTAAYPLLAGGAGVAPAYGQLNLAGAGITGTLALTNGGTGVTAAEGNGTKIQLFSGANPATNDCAKYDVNHNIVGAGGSCVTGTGTAGAIPKFTGAGAIGNSIIADNGAGTAVVTGSISASANLTLSALTTGSIPFIGAAGLFSQDNANLFWDDTNNRLGIGTATPATTLDVISKFQVNSSGILKKYNNIASAGNGQPFIQGVVDLTGQIATVGPTNILTTPTAGMYRFTSYANTVTVAGGACTMVLAYDYTDSTGAKTQTLGALNLNTATDHQDNAIRVWVNSGSITYTATVAGAGCGGAERWDLHIRAEAL